MTQSDIVGDGLAIRLYRPSFRAVFENANRSNDLDLMPLATRFITNSYDRPHRLLHRYRVEDIEEPRDVGFIVIDVRRDPHLRATNRHVDAPFPEASGEIVTKKSVFQAPKTVAKDD